MLHKVVIKQETRRLSSRMSMTVEHSVTRCSQLASLHQRRYSLRIGSLTKRGYKKSLSKNVEIPVDP